MQPIAHPRTSRIVSVLVAIAIFGACTGSSSVGSPAAGTPDAPAGSAPVDSPAAPTPSTAMEPSRDAWLAVGRKGEPGLQVILAGTQEQLYELPLGVPNDKWGYLVATEQAGDETLVREITVQPDLPASTRTVQGHWRLPTIGLDTIPVGVSADGATIVLVEDGVAADAATTRFAVLARGQATTIIELQGSFEFDALSADGRILYVVEHLPGPPDAHYQVRAVDLPGGQVRDAVIVDKRNVDEQMGGWPITQARHDNGVVFTLYRGSANPFIHALNANEAWAICLDLPEDGAGDPIAAQDWGIAVSADGGAVYAVNATLGLASTIDPGELTFRKTVSFDAPRAAATITLAKFGHQESGPVGRRAVISSDGGRLYAAGARGIVTIETQGLTRTGAFLEGAAVDGLALTPDGSTLYALLSADGRIVKIDAASGELLGEVAGNGYDRLVAVVPW